MCSTTLYLWPKSKRQWSINNFTTSIFENQWAVQPHCSIIKLSAAFLDKSACNYIVTMSYNERQWRFNTMSHRSDFFACTSRVNISQPAIRSTITLLSAVTPGIIPIIFIPTVMSDSQSLNTSMLEVIIYPKNERVFIRDLTDLSLQIIFET